MKQIILNKVEEQKEKGKEKEKETTSNKRLLLFFAGWGMDAEPFKPFLHLCPADTDFMVCYDYSELDFKAELLKRYTHIDLIAWSMGVWVAHYVMQEHGIDFQYSVAINGTLFPVNNEKGINTSVFLDTVYNFNEDKLQKFRRRMCKSQTAYHDFRKREPKRSAHQLKLELTELGALYLYYEENQLFLPGNYQWDCAVVGKCDRVFLPKNQLQGWENHAKRVITMDIAHYEYSLPFFVKEVWNERY